MVLNKENELQHVGDYELQSDDNQDHIYIDVDVEIRIFRRKSE